MPVGAYSPNKSTAAASATVFPYTFQIFDKAHLQVTVDGVVKSEGTDYTVDGVGTAGGGNVTFLTPMVGGETVIRERVVPYTRTEDYQPNGSFKEENVDRDLDLRTMQIQQLAEQILRAMVAPVGTALTQPAIPAPEALKFLRWKNDLSGLENVTAADVGALIVSPYAETLLDDADAPTARATLGATAVGDDLFTAASAAAGRTALGATALGSNLFTAATALAARGVIGEKYLRLEDYGGAADGTTDNTAALNSAVAAMAAAGTRIIKLGIGTYRFASKPNDFTTGVILIGEGMSLTTLRRDYTAGGTDEGFLTWSGSGSNGGGAYGLLLRAENGTSSGSMFKFYTGAADVAGYHWLDQVVVTYTGTGTYERALLVDGQLNVTSGSQGLRDFHCGRAFLFQGASGSESARFKNATNLAVEALWANGLVAVSGGGTALSNTTDARISLTCLAQLAVVNTLGLVADGIVSTLSFGSGSQNCEFYGHVKTTPGGIIDTGTNNTVVARFGRISWTPTPTSLTVDGTPTYTGLLVKIGAMVFGALSITSTGSTSATAGTTYFTGLPVLPAQQGTCVAANGALAVGLGTGLVGTDGRIWVPSWTTLPNVQVTFNYIV